MKTVRTMFLSALCAVGAFSSDLRAESQEFESSSILSVFKKYPSRFQIGGNYTYVHIQPKGTSSCSGNLGGVQGMYEYRLMNSFYGAVKGMWRQGNTSSDQLDRYLINVDVQERLGYTIATVDERYLVSLFTGFGYRYLGHNLTNGSQTIETNYNELYVPVGFLFDYAVNSIVSLGLYATWMAQVDPTVTINPIGGARLVMERRYMNLLVEMPLTLSMGVEHQFLVILKPFYESWQDGTTIAKTTSGAALGLPSNNYSFAGIELNLGYQF